LKFDHILKKKDLKNEIIKKYLPHFKSTNILHPQLLIIIIINEYLEAGQGPLFPPEVDNIYTNINQN